MDTKEADRALREYSKALLGRVLPSGTLYEQCVLLLSGPGFILSEEPRCGLAGGVLLCYELVSRDWWRAVPAAIALDFTNCAIELFDKLLDDESLPPGEYPFTSPQYLNIASCLQSLAHHAIDDLEGQGFPRGTILRGHRTIADIVVETSDAQARDLLAEGSWLTFEQALALATGKGAPLAGGIGGLGASLSSDDAELVETCVTYFREVGTYSQLVNDLNDAMPGAIHKSDVRKRKSTLPLVYFLGLASDDHREARGILRGETPISPEQEALIRRALENSGALDFAATVAEIVRLRARNALLPLESKYDTTPLLRAFLGWS